MVKKMTVALLCTVLGTSLYAENFSTGTGFIGLEVGYATVQGDVDDGYFGIEDREGDSVEYGFRIGAQNNTWRTMFAFDYYDSSDDDQNMEKGLIMFDYFLMQEDDDAFRPYIGVNVGYANYESTDIEDDGFLYGGQVGFTVNVAETVDLDLGYRYSLSDSDALDHTSSIIFGVSYLF